MIYQYQCPNDGEMREVERKMTDPEDTYVCNTCGATLNRVWTAVPISFKGPGFYKTDNAN